MHGAVRWRPMVAAGTASALHQLEAGWFVAGLLFEHPVLDPVRPQTFQIKN
jgi:hypothetical protein